MKKTEILKAYELRKLDNLTVVIHNAYFFFSYTVADAVVKDELKGKYRYFGGLQCPYHEDTQEYKDLENWLCEIAEKCVIKK